MNALSTAGLTPRLDVSDEIARILFEGELAHRVAAGSGVFSFRSFPTVSCIASSLSASPSSQSCIFTVDQGTGGRGSEALLPNSAFDRTAGSSALAAAAQRVHWTATKVGLEPRRTS